MTSTLAAFRAAGQSLWLDAVSRGLLRSGELARLVGAGITGVTSNPTIFAKAFAARADYAQDVERLGSTGLDSQAIYESLVAVDIREAADLLLPAWGHSERWDGCVSVEVAPRTAHDEAATLAEAERWCSAIARPNVMIKVPATDAGLRALTELVHRGRNVNVTLIFGVEQYSRTIDAWLAGLERRHAEGAVIGGIACVASFFLSRIDSAVDPRLEQIAREDPTAADLVGGTALDVARLAYERYRALAEDPRWIELRHAGASVQRLLWASTGAKSAAFGPTHYVDRLALPGTVNTLPPETLEAVLRQGRPSGDTLVPAAEAQRRLARLAALGIDADALARELQRQGLDKFAASYAEAVSAVAWRHAETFPDTPAAPTARAAAARVPPP
ncbi:MAG: transaldolase [Steroidobacteraceae bacterium]|jgi:transaldolase|nr:transaldolase [Steroidobacteraceae bacterium]